MPTTTQPIPPRNRIKWRLRLALTLLIGGGFAIGVAAKVFSDRGAVTAKNENREDERPAPAKSESQGTEPETVRLSPEVARKYGVRIGVAKKRKLTSSIVAPARVSYNGEATAIIGTPIQGRVVEVKARAGDVVEKKAELLVIESSELGEAQSDYLQKHAAVTTAKTVLAPSADMYARARRLYEDSQGISLTELQKREVDLRQAEGALVNADAATVAAANKLHLLGMSQQDVDNLLSSGAINSHYIIRSPLAGQVIERAVNLGELVKPEREKLLVVADTKIFWVWADVPESRAREVEKGAPARISLASNAAASQAATADLTFPGVVSHIAPSIDPETRSLRVRIEVKNNAALRPGMFVLVEIGGKANDENAESVLAVPQSAIQIVDGTTAVFVPVQDEANAFKLRPVSTGNCVDGQACILAGLKEGERVVVAGSAILKADLLKASAKDED